MNWQVEITSLVKQVSDKENSNMYRNYEPDIHWLHMRLCTGVHSELHHFSQTLKHILGKSVPTYHIAFTVIRGCVKNREIR
jgi:hypothetical protein